MEFNQCIGENNVSLSLSMMNILIKVLFISLDGKRFIRLNIQLKENLTFKSFIMSRQDTI